MKIEATKKFLKDLPYSYIVILILSLVILHASSDVKNSSELLNLEKANTVKIVDLSVVQNPTLSKDQNITIDTPNTLYEVVKVVDGDTIDVIIGSSTERLRIIGIDTPETKDPRKVVQCFGAEASNEAHKVLYGKSVYLERDYTQGDRDKYGRLLRYVYFENKKSFELHMITNGFAHEYTYRIPYKYQKEYKEAELEAMERGSGFWAKDTCSGDTLRGVKIS